MPVARAVDGDASALVVSLLFPVFDLVVSSLALISIAWSGRGRERLSGWVVLGLVLFASGDWQFVLGMTRGTWQVGYPADALWVLGLIAIGVLAAARPRAQVTGDRWGLATMGLTLVSAAVALVVMVVGTTTEVPRPGVLLAAACLAVALLRMLSGYLEMRDLAEIKELARTDELTGLGNRRLLYEALDDRLADGGPHAVLLSDLSRFKAINDQYGHAAGDQVLSRVADGLRRTFPTAAVLARLGGDEFVVVTPVSRPDDVLDLAWRLVQAVREVEGPHGATVDASVGAVDSRDFPGATRSDLLRLADVGMYTAKIRGTLVCRIGADDPIEQLEEVVRLGAPSSR